MTTRLRRNMILVLLVGAVVAGCASKDAGPRTAANRSSVGGPMLLSALPNSAIPKGSCGMVLWTLDAERPVAIFRYLAGKDADVIVDGVPLKITITHSDGAAAFGVNEVQRFASGPDLSVEVKVRFTTEFEGGIYVERGLIAIERLDGWRTVTPAAGIAGCRR